MKKAIQQIHVPFNDLNEVPAAFRMLAGARLSLEQVNKIVDDAHRLQFERDGVSVLDIGKAKADFRKTHETESGLWVTRKKGK